MITGFYNARGRPLIEGEIDLLHCSGPVRFLLDTGADITTIMPDTGRLLGIDYGRLTFRQDAMRGVSGSIDIAAAVAEIRFVEHNGKDRRYRLNVCLTPNIEALEGLPSILGMDILSRWRTDLDPSRGMLRITVRSADLTLPGV